MPDIFSLDSTEQIDRALVGGKAYSLVRMIRGGVPVPPGYVVTTDAYSAFLKSNHLETQINELVANLDYGRAEDVEDASEAVRKLITSSPLPEDVAANIKASYEALGDTSYVAVRSSGTAEDMGDASFAGLYDSYLDIRGSDVVIDAVLRCWGSLWTARCASYRHRLGIAIEEATVAVVVQRMVAAESAGVLFTANPLTERTDQMVVNANWGLGESIASGIVTPDEFLVNAKTLAVSSTILGSKEVSIIRASDGKGTVKVDVDAARRSQFSLSDARVSELAAIGRRVVDLSGGTPQDIEWALEDGVLHILQSREITGAKFLYDEDIEAWQRGDDDVTVTWSHTWAKAYWTGAVSPLFYSARGRELANSDRRLFTLWGFKELIATRRFKYRRSTVYFSCDADRIYYQIVLPKRLRQHSLQNLPPDWRDDAAKARWRVGSFLMMHLRVRFLSKDHGPLRTIKSVYKFIDVNGPVAAKPSPAELRTYSDDELKTEIAVKIKMFEDYLTILRPAFHIYSPVAFGIVQEMIKSWYTGENEYAFQDLISGLPQRTAMMQEQVDMWELSEHFNRSEELKAALFRAESGAEFFADLEASDDGRTFLVTYQGFLAKHGHRGHQDRDLWYARRAEDPQIDFQALKALVSAGARSPEINEEHLIAKREESTAEVLANIGGHRFGRVKVALFTKVLNYIHRFLVLRDDERPFADMVTMSKKRAFAELGLRLHERGLLEGADDYFFLAEQELYQVLDGTAKSSVVRAKVENRRDVFDKFLLREEVPADYLRGGNPLDIDDGAGTDEEGVFQGVGMSRGTITGRARIIRDLREIGKVGKGEILICNSTDPGWTPVFGLISGLVLESGGMLSHGACLSREYGLPALTLPLAIQRVPDGATITVNGDSGRLKVHLDEEVSA